MSSPVDALAILRQRLPQLFAQSAPAADPQSGAAPAPAGPIYDDPTGSLQLRGLQESREGELQDRLANDQFGRGDPNTGRDAALLKFLQGDMASDPYTGTAAQARTQKVQDALDTAATTTRPEIGAAADTVAKRNAFAKFLGVGAEARAKDEEAISPAGTAAADAVSRRKVAEARAAHPDPSAAYGGGAAAGSDAANTVNWWTQQALNDPTILPKISDKALRKEVEHNLAKGGGDLNNVTTQTRRMGEVANAILPMIDEVQQQGADLKDAGLFAPGIGWARRKLGEHGLNTVAGMSPQLAEQSANFDSKIGYLKSAIQNAHAGMKGAGSPAMMAAFERLMNATGDYPSFLGDLDSARELLQLYGNASPGTRPKPAAGASSPAADPAAGFSITRH